MTLGTPDFIVIGFVIFSILIGIIRGFIKESISLVTWIVAIFLAVRYTSSLSAYVTVSKHEDVHTLLAFLIIFIGTVFVGALINFVIGGFIRKTPFSVPDRVLGSLFGLLRGMVFVTILVLLAGLTPLPEEEWWQQSYSLHRFQNLAIWIKERLPEEHEKAFRFPFDDDERDPEHKNAMLLKHKT